VVLQIGARVSPRLARLIDEEIDRERPCRRRRRPADRRESVDVVVPFERRQACVDATVQACPSSSPGRHAPRCQSVDVVVPFARTPLALVLTSSAASARLVRWVSRGAPFHARIARHDRCVARAK
jgi:hypothetical protein